MGKYKLTIWFISLFTFYFLVRFVRKNWLEAPAFIKYHLTDLIFVPTMCIFALIILRFVKRNNSISISSTLIFTQVAIVSIYFEWFLPKYRSHIHPYTSDIWDVFMYVLGGFIFLYLQRRFFTRQNL
jgi:hypothetical protein